MKVCATCKQSLRLNQFGKDKHNKDGLNYSCKECRRISEKQRIALVGAKDYYKRRNHKTKSYRKKRYSDDPDSVRDYNYRKKFGKTLSEYRKLFDDQRGVCAICSVPWIVGDKIFAWDHDHTTNKVRGILCERCNRALGLLRDDVEVLKNAIKYLERHTNENDL